MTEKNIYKIANDVMQLTGTLYHLVPDIEEERKQAMQRCYDRVQEQVLNMARMASASQEVI